MCGRDACTKESYVYRLNFEMTVQTDHLKINQNKHVLEYYSVLKHSCKFKWFWVDDKINKYHPFKKEREASTCTFIMKRKF